MIYKSCRKCGKLIIHPNTYCSDCQVIVNQIQEQYQKERDSRYNKKRDPKYKEFYNSKEWRMLKDKKMQDEQYLCENCNKLATEVHHKKPIQVEKWWPFRLDYDNLEALCVECHNLRHDRFKRKGGVINEIKTNRN